MLWLLDTFPAWVFHGILGVGFVTLIIGAIANKIPPVAQYGLLLKVGGLCLIIAGLMFEGALSLKKDYDLKTGELQHKLEIAATQGETIVTRVVEELVYRDRVITKQGATVIQYIDREAEKIDATCTLSVEAVKAHNDAAATPLRTEEAK